MAQDAIQKAREIAAEWTIADCLLLAIAYSLRSMNRNLEAIARK